MGIATSDLRWPAESPGKFSPDSLLPLPYTLILAGAMGFMSYYLRASTWMVWALMTLIVTVLWRRLRLGHLLVPLRPYLLWLGFYMVWGLIVANYRDYSFAFKVMVTTVLLGGCAAVSCANVRNLARLAMAAQFAVMANLLVLVLANMSSHVAQVIQTITLRSASFEEGLSRYGGLWGNPNMAGYICLVATLLSVFAAPWAARLGRLSCLPLLYLSSSRKSVVLYLAILALYLIMVRRRSLKFWLGAVTLIMALGMAFTLSSSLRKESAAVERNPYVSRLLDLTETSQEQRGDETRVELFKEWYEVLANEPWYGYGLEAMAGTLYSSENRYQVLNKGILPLGTHNTYLGVWIETGPFGFAVFMAVMLMYLRRCFTVRGPARIRWALVSLALVNAIFLFVSHSHLFSPESQIVCTLMFLLPNSPAIRGFAGHGGIVAS